MSDDIKIPLWQFIEEFVSENTPELEITPKQSTRNANEGLLLIYDAIVFVSSLGAFGGLWALCKHVSQRYSRCKVVIKYIAVGGEEIELEYSDRSDKEMEEIVSKYPPKLSTGTEMLVYDDSGI